MKLNDKKVLVCNCERTMALDGDALAKALGADECKVASHICRSQLNVFEAEAADGVELLVACTQEAPLFVETLQEMGENAPDVSFTNIREKAGWSDAGRGDKPSKDMTAKMAALLAEAAMDIASTPSVTMESSGVVLVLGKDEAAVDAAKRIADRLDVTVVLNPETEIAAPAVMDVPVFRGRVVRASGHLGAFGVEVEGFQPAAASSRGNLQFDGVPGGGTSECDLILDLRGGEPLFPAPEKRDGYFNPDPGNPALVMAALFDLADMVGGFEKPRYIDYDEKICAHASARIVGCSRCLDVCPTSAIQSVEDKVAYDPYVCAGCGLCAAVCPTGAAQYNVPAEDAVPRRLRTLVTTYLKAGGTHPVVLVHDGAWGDEMIGAMARFGGGLPANVLPFTLNQSTQIGLDFVLAAVAFGAERVLVLVPPAKHEDAKALAGEFEFAEAVFKGLGYGAGRAALLDDTDPEALEARLKDLQPMPGVPRADFLPMGRKRAVMRLALDALHAAAPNKVDEVALPAGAPFGAVIVDTEGCTLCLACVGACPTGALNDNEDKPQLSFAEQACVQCGLCRNTCPESVITLAPRLSFLDAARSHQVVKEEEPFHCIRCDKPFAAKSSIDRMTEKLKDHAMFAEPGKLDRLKMCDDCRVIAIAEEDTNPLASGTVPIPRTTEDYLREREELREQARADMRARGLDVSNDDDPKGSA